MNRVSFGQLLTGTQDPPKSLAMFGKSEKLERIKALESSVNALTRDLDTNHNRVDQLGADLGNSLLAIKQLEFTMTHKASKKDVETEKTERYAALFDLRKTTRTHGEIISKLRESQQGIQENQQTILTSSLYQMEAIHWLKDAVRALRDGHPLPLLPHEATREEKHHVMPARRVPDKVQKVRIPNTQENRVVLYRHPPPANEPDE